MNYEIRLNDDESLDEVVVHEPLFVHLEQMSDDSWWLGIDLKNGKVININLWSKRKIRARAEVE